MTLLRAGWLGSWTVPWSLGRGRHWGDAAWALAAIAQAWMLGGRHGQWPRADWEGKSPQGPRVTRIHEGFTNRPDPAWMALLRHGRTSASADQRGRRESDLIHHGWEALRNGDPMPWMQLGMVLLDRPTRSRWVALLGAVDPDGGLLLPPFLEPLVPPELQRLPPGWWECLLSRMDTEGRLLPEGTPDLPWQILEPPLRDWLTPLVLPDLPETLTRVRPWAWQGEGGVWMLDPRLRAWARGVGLHPEALDQLRPASLALGDPTSADTRDALAPICTADPFQWMARGHQAMADSDHPVALAAFRWAHAHFQRLRHAGGVCLAADGAFQAALGLGDLPAAAAWRRLRGQRESPWQELEEAQWQSANGDPKGALKRLVRLLRIHPELQEAQALASQLRVLILDEPLELELPPGPALLQAFAQWRMDPGHSTAFWEAWARERHVPLRLETGLSVLESCHEARTPARLQELKPLVDRSAAPLYQTRLKALWPRVEAGLAPTAEDMVRHWLATRRVATWVAWGSHPPLGTGSPPPTGFLEHLRNQGDLEPVQTEGQTWWGFPLTWEGTAVGWVLTVLDPHRPLQDQTEARILAPWIHRLLPTEPALPPEPEAADFLTDGSEPMASVMAELERVARSDLPVLILGPTGSGKEVTARLIHTRSGRKGPFRAINCSELSDTLLESELFGHTKGAYTGAHTERKGLIEQSDQGTLLLDEVADLSTRLQSLFLRVLQEKEVRRIGSEHLRRVNVRFLAATHRPLDQMVACGQFRQDLHFRLTGSVLTLPSLQQRRHEFPYLIPRLVWRIAQEHRRPCPELDPGLAQALARHPWQGNMRELQYALERAMLRREEGPLRPCHFREFEAPTRPHAGLKEATWTFQRSHVLDTLKRHRFNLTESAKELKLSRPALYSRLKELAIHVDQERQGLQA